MESQLPPVACIFTISTASLFTIRLKIRIPAGELIRRLAGITGKTIKVTHVRGMSDGSHKGRYQQLTGQAIPIETQKPSKE